MTRILVIFTGGTIGSASQGGKVDVRAAGSYTLIDQYMKQHGREGVTFETIQPLNVLSENIVPADWQTLLSAIKGVDQAKADGIIITHGSDTLAYTAALVSYAMHDAAIPIVLTASNYPLEDPRSNGLKNFAAAVDFIAGGSVPGVFVIYGNAKGESLVYLGTRMTQAVAFTDQFGSPYDLVWGQMSSGELQLIAHEYNPTVEQLRERAGSAFRDRGVSGAGGGIEAAGLWVDEAFPLSTDIVYIKPYPGLDYSYYNFSSKAPRAVLHDLHHSGTACSSDEEPYSLVSFIQHCRANGAQVYLCPLKNLTEAMYGSSHRLMEAGAKYIAHQSVEASLIKLMIAYARFDSPEEIAAFLDADVFYENHVGQGHE
ncbi:asparaginase [Paenibacillus sp. GCM10023252]|uniref:asparaginase n=1 Tax=Paenibacillus sp. GCM10023252 TaxID=3252649 RepID=UPI003619D935